MQFILTDDRGFWTAEWIKVPFGVNTPGGPWNIVLDGGPDPPQRKVKWPTFKFWDPLISPNDWG